MKFSVAKSDFYNALHKIIGVVPQKTTIPVLTCLLMDLQK
ncbi:DNA polymerase III subunit beta, partial [candidate division KSB1 bacterium]|nr:DNA polymerase III subunit beta [candidate division KSB1 bacterium]